MTGRLDAPRPPAAAARLDQFAGAAGRRPVRPAWPGRGCAAAGWAGGGSSQICRSSALSSVFAARMRASAKTSSGKSWSSSTRAALPLNVSRSCVPSRRRGELIVPARVQGVLLLLLAPQVDAALARAVTFWVPFSLSWIISSSRRRMRSSSLISRASGSPLRTSCASGPGNPGRCPTP